MSRPDTGSSILQIKHNIMPVCQILNESISAPVSAQLLSVSNMGIVCGNGPKYTILCDYGIYNDMPLEDKLFLAKF